MMRGRNFVSCAVRRANGEIVLKNGTIPKGVYAGVWSKTPFLRALPVLWDTLVLGTQMLTWAANVQASDELAKEQKAKRESGDTRAIVNALENEATMEAIVGGAGGTTEGAALMIEAERESESVQPKLSAPPDGRGDTPAAPETRTTKEQEGLPPAALYSTLAVSLGLGIAVFFLLPVLVASFLGNFGVTPFWNNIIEGLIRLALFLGYLLLIGRVPEIQRVFMYHGAEHKTIAAYEGGAQLVPAQIQKFSKEHPRFGTGFLLTVVVISILFFVLLGDLPLPLRLASRIILIPIVAAVSYELIRFASQHRNFFLFDWLIVRPSLALQSLTTREPTDDMIQVAVAAFQDVRQREERLVGQV